MKKPLYFTIWFAITILLFACTNGAPGNNTNRLQIIYINNDSPEERRAEIFQDTQIITFNNTAYNSYITRNPNDSLPYVTGKDGITYVDNVITLRITRGNVSIFNRTFTKNSFAFLVDGEFLREATLEGRVYDKTTSEGIKYAVSLCYPQTDLYMPISITIDTYGRMAMIQAEEMPEETTHKEHSLHI
ncbi:hypothetical protein EZS27_007163 [termite gut metagenome]|uniref:DUF4738 domain-containing protein n=1 Tax=termite gut metagenome TaxID=433724 RepID=A0A5J4SHL4_9ZZZZ